MKYAAELEHLSNEQYEIPSHLKEFEVTSRDMDGAIKVVRDQLGIYMLDKDDYNIDAGLNYDQYAELSFGDSHTGQDVRYSISLMEK